jgi:hypothetical protein
MIKFRQKAYSDNVISGALDGVKYGAGVGTVLAGILKVTKSDKKISPYLVVGGSILAGAALGALAGKVKDNNIQKSRVDAGVRLFDSVLDNLRKIGFKEGQDFTQDPRMANIMKTKVCIVVSRNSGGLKLLINTVDDPELKGITKKIHSSLGRNTVSTERVNNKFNELTITTMSSNGGDATFVTRIIEMFIRNGYPVYIVEVG